MDARMCMHGRTQVHAGMQACRRAGRQADRQTGRHARMQARVHILDLIPALMLTNADIELNLPH